MKFYSAKGLFTGLIIWGVILLLAGISAWDIYEQGSPDKILLHLINGLIIALLAWIWFGTFYKIEGDSIYYQSGPIRGSLPISSIRKLTPNKNMWAGLKIALATKGIIIQYNKWDDIYISPENNEAFIVALLAINKNIEVQA